MRLGVGARWGSRRCRCRRIYGACSLVVVVIIVLVVIRGAEVGIRVDVCSR